MSKFGRQSDETLRPWTLNENFDKALSRQCDELGKSMRRTSPYKQGGDYSYIQRVRLDHSDSDAEASMTPSKFPADSDPRPIKSGLARREIMNQTVPPHRLPNVIIHSPPPTHGNSAVKTRRRSEEASKIVDRHQFDSSLLINSTDQIFPANMENTSPNNTNASADTSKVPYSATSYIKEISNQSHRFEKEIQVIFGTSSTIPFIPKRDMMESSSTLGPSSKSMPNLMEFTSAFNGIQERERRADTYATKRRSIYSHSYPSSPSDVTHDFYTQNFNQLEKVEGSILGRRKIKKMKSLEEHMMTSSGTQNIHLHPDASASHRAEITHFADVSRQMAADAKDENTLDSTYNRMSLHDFNNDSDYISETTLAHTSNNDFMNSIKLTDKTQHIKIDTMSKWSRNAARNKVPIFTKGGTMKFN